MLVERTFIQMKKLILLTLMALSFFVTAKSTKADGAWPMCDPCPWVR